MDVDQKIEFTKDLLNKNIKMIEMINIKALVSLSVVSVFIGFILSEQGIFHLADIFESVKFNSYHRDDVLVFFGLMATLIAIGYGVFLLIRVLLPSEGKDWSSFIKGVPEFYVPMSDCVTGNCDQVLDGINKERYLKEISDVCYKNLNLIQAKSRDLRMGIVCFVVGMIGFMVMYPVSIDVFYVPVYKVKVS